MSEFNIIDHPHRRFNALTGEWILVSPHRSKRPWQGQVEKNQEEKRPAYDPTCYLCPGNQRVGSDMNPKYESTYVFTNDFSALLSDTPEGSWNDGDIFKAESEQGICRVICFSPRHDLTIPEMEVSAIREVVDLWCAQFEELGKLPFVNYIQIFENKGAIMGCSNPHPHGQIWSSKLIPQEVLKEIDQQKSYFEKHGRSLLSDYIKRELELKTRILAENDTCVALIPFWAVWPFEAMIVPKRQVTNLLEMSEAERSDFADMYKQLTVMYDNLFEVSFPYSAGIHQAPTNDDDNSFWHLHMHFFPPLLRSASVKKFMVGYEMLASPQRDITAEGAADRLRSMPKTHFKQA